MDRELPRWWMSASDFRHFVDALFQRFDRVIGPTVDGDVVRMRELGSVDDLPVGVVDEQEAGTYRVRRIGTPLHFSYGVGPDSLKSIVHPARSPVWTMRRRDGSLVVDPAVPRPPSTAVLGVRACDLRALSVLEHTQTGGAHADPGFVARRAGPFLVAVDCSYPAPTCFCGTLGGGPVADSVYDVALTELIDPASDTAEYVVRAGTEAGRAVLASLELAPAPASLVRRGEAELRRADRALLRELPANAADVVREPEHPHWEIVAQRCLTCGNCTAVCPTCFCTDMEDRVSLDGETATRTRVWDTCFSGEYSHLGAGPHRSSSMSRYRQWLSHKLGTWHEQYGESGCVGCGRCVTWCPVGIDLTAEVESLARAAVV